MEEDKISDNIDSKMSCYLINLDRNKDRLDHFKKIYYDSDLRDKKLNIISAVDGKRLTLDEIRGYIVPELIDTLIHIDKTGKKPDSKYLTRGMLGCYLSHINIYKQFLETKGDYCMIFEDDAIFDDDLNKNIQHYMNNIPDDWDVILMGYVYILKSETVNSHINKILEFWGTQGYIIRRNGIEKILKYKNIPIDNQIDYNMSELAKENILRIYAPIESCVKQGPYSTDVQL